MKTTKRSPRKAKFEVEKAEREEEYKKSPPEPQVTEPAAPMEQAAVEKTEAQEGEERFAGPVESAASSSPVDPKQGQDEVSVLGSISPEVAVGENGEPWKEAPRDPAFDQPAGPKQEVNAPEEGTADLRGNVSPGPVVEPPWASRAEQAIDAPKPRQQDEALTSASTDGARPQALAFPETVSAEEAAGTPEIEEFTVLPKQKKGEKRKQKKQKRKKKKGGRDGPEEEGGEDGPLRRRQAEDQAKIVFSDRLVRMALRYTRAPTRYLVAKMPSLRENLLRSNLRISPEGIVSLSLLFSIITIPFTIIGWFLLARMGYGLEGLALPAVAVVPFFIGITIPKISASSRAQALDNELPYLIAYVTVLAGGGISPIVTLKRITKAGELFPAAAKEAKRILMDIEIFGLDAISALERGARFTPNKVFSDFIGGYVAVLKTGGDALSFLEAKLKEIFGYREAKVKSGSEFIATMSEAYIISTVIMGISLMTLFATQNLMTPSLTTLNYTMILMFSGFFVPIISLIFIIVIGSSQIREPFSYDLPFYVFLGCIPLGAVLYFLPLHLSSYMQLGIALTAISTPPMFLQMKFKREKESVEAKLSNFLRDISEIRKTGLAPEKTIEQLANRNYGKLGHHVKKIAAQLSWGTPIKTVLQNFTKEVKSWVARAVAFLLLEVVDVGGGSPKMFISLADFAEKNAQLEKEKKSLVRPYMIIPYIGAILIVATTAMMVWSIAPSNLNFPGAGQSGTNYLPPAYIIAEATTILLMASFFQAWVMGFVAGKMGEGSAADGFKHATFLIVISMVTVIVAGFFIQL